MPNEIIENVIDGIITVNDRGLIESINPSACKLFGYDPEEVVGKNIAMCSCLHPIKAGTTGIYWATSILDRLTLLV